MQVPESVARTVSFLEPDHEKIPVPLPQMVQSTCQFLRDRAVEVICKGAGRTRGRVLLIIAAPTGW